MAVIRGDARAIPLRDETVQCVVTSPPYWSLRDYQTPGQIGLERSIGEYIGTLVGVFEEVRRVLRPDGVVFINVGDAYSSGGRQTRDPGQSKIHPALETAFKHGGRCNDETVKPKDLCLIPERLAIALQESGWYVRSRIAWVKPAPMPESVTDRPTSAWEHIWMLTKGSSYFYDAEAVREALVRPDEFDRKTPAVFGGAAKHNGYGTRKHSGNPYVNDPGGRNLRNWWNIGPDPSSEAYCVACDFMYDHAPPPPKPGMQSVCVRCKGKLTAHYAAFPRELVRKCVLAGTPEKGVCARCGRPWVRVVDSSYEKSLVHGDGSVVGRHYETGANGWDGAGLPRVNKVTQTLGWQPQCSCDAPTIPALVFDPFSGTGTTILVAESLGRRAVGLELSWEYCRYGQRRNSQSSLFSLAQQQPQCPDDAQAGDDEAGS